VWGLVLYNLLKNLYLPLSGFPTWLVTVLSNYINAQLPRPNLNTQDRLINYQNICHGQSSRSSDTTQSLKDRLVAVNCMRLEEQILPAHWQPSCLEVVLLLLHCFYCGIRVGASINSIDESDEQRGFCRGESQPWYSGLDSWITVKSAGDRRELRRPTLHDV